MTESVAMRSALFVFVTQFLITLSVAQSGPLDQWTWRGPSPTSNSLYGIAYGNGLFVAVGATDGPGAIITSPDGVNWTRRSSPTKTALLAITFDNRQFVAVGKGGVIQSSPDGIHWIVHPSATTVSLSGICYGGGVYVAVGDAGEVVTSFDGMTWQRHDAITTEHLSSVTFGNGTFVAVGGYRTFLRSTDGITWTLVESGRGFPDHQIQDVTFGNGIFVAVGDDSVTGHSVITSSDGMNWTNAPVSCPSSFHGVVFAAGQFVAVADRGACASSIDGVNWACSAAVDPAQPLYRVGYGAGRFVGVGKRGALLSSLDGRNWTRIQTGAIGTLWDVAWGNSTFVAVGMQNYDTLSGQAVLTSQSGVIWRQEAGLGLPNPPALGSVAFGGNRFVAMSQGSDAGFLSQVSTNGSEWQADVFFGRSDSGAVAYGSGLFVGVGSGVAVSETGLRWTPISMTTPLFGVGFGAGQFIAVGWQGTILVSTNAFDWESVQSGTTASLYRVGFGGGRYVAIGQDGVILVSDDGHVWSRAPSGTTMPLRGVSYGDGNFVVVGASGTILSSTDGLTWTTRGSGTRNDLYGVTYARDCFIAVGLNETILQSGVKQFSLRFDKIQASPTGFAAHIAGDPGRSFRIEESTNLVDWREGLVPDQQPTGELGLDNSAALPCKFYRAVAP